MTGAKCTAPQCPLNTGIPLWHAPVDDLYSCLADVNRRMDAIGKTMHALKSWESEEANRIDDCEEQIHDIRMKIGMAPLAVPPAPVAEPAAEPAAAPANDDEVVQKVVDGDDGESDAENPLKKRRVAVGELGDILQESLPLSLLPSGPAASSSGGD